MVVRNLRFIRKWAADTVAAAMYRGNLWAPYLRMRTGVGKGALILVFHRLVDDDTRYLRKGPTVQTHVRLFEEVLEHICRHYRVMDLNQVVHHLVEGRPFERRSVALTFDDGYEDNYRLGLPLCARFGVPGTLYLATGSVADNGNGLFWNDRVEQALLATRLRQLDLAELGVPNGEQLNLDTAQNRIHANLWLGEAAKQLAPEPRNAFLSRLERTLEVDASAYRRAMLTWEEVRALADAGWEIGSHGVSHTILPLLSTAEAVAELRDSKRLIEAQVGRPVRHFAFPNGRAQDFNPELGKACTEAGYTSVASCVSRVNRPEETSPYLLRVGVTRNMARTALVLERHFMVAG